MSETPKPGMHVAVDLNDRGRVGVSERVGPEVARIEGVLERSGDTARVLRVTAVTKIGGERSRWAGEAVSLRNEYVKDMAERRLSKSRTALAAGVAAAAVAAFIVTRELVGGGDPENPGGIIDPNPTLRVRVLRVP